MRKKIMIEITTDREVLHQVSEEVTDFDDTLEIAQELVAAMGEAGGIGISAIQLGMPLRMFAILYRDGSVNVFINPESIEKEKLAKSHQEGCLSVPDKRVDKKRYRRITVKYQDPSETWHEEKLANLEAFVFQHELDHLNGILIDDGEKAKSAPTLKLVDPRGNLI